MVLVKVKGLSIDARNNSPIVLLQEQSGERVLPIWIGLLEATAIASELEKITFSRPMTHDLIINILNALNRPLVKVEIVDIKDNIFYANLYLNSDGAEPVKMDCRPSDAIALALRANAPLFVAGHIFEGNAAARPDADNEEKWRELLERMSPEDFGKYKM